MSRGLLNQYIAALAACVSVINSSACYGWVTPILDHLLGPDSEIPMTSGEASWVISIIEIGNLVSPLPAGVLSDYIGRKPVILATGPLYIISWLMIIFFPSVFTLGAARVLQGFAMGLTFTVAPVYLGEIACKTTRGAITSIFFNSWWLGFLIQYAVGPLLSFNNFTYFTLAMNIPFLLLFFWQPESPYYDLMCGKEEKARRSLMWFRGATPDELNEELEEIKFIIQTDKKLSNFVDIISSPEKRKVISVLIVITGIRPLCGSGVIAVYATDIFNLTPNLSIPSDVVTIALGATMLVGGVVSSFTSDSVGRRPLLMMSCVGTFVCQFITGTYYFLLLNTSLKVSQYSWIAPSLILVYSGLCTVGIYPVCSSYISELFNSNTRGTASSIGAINVTVCSFILLVLYQPVNNYLGLYANFYIYSLSVLIGGMYLYFNAPETKGKSFAQIRKELRPFKSQNDAI